MGFFKDYRETRARLTAAESIATLSAMERFFRGGRNWTQGAYHRMNGNKCLVGAAQAVPVGAINDARYWLRCAIVDSIETMRGCRSCKSKLSTTTIRSPKWPQ